MNAERTPVILAIGEIADRPSDPFQGLEPAALMAEAFERAEADAGAALAARIDSLTIVNEISWGYDDILAVVCEKAGLSPAHRYYGPVGGESPIRYLHEAAARISAGESRFAVVCGGEAQHTVTKAGADATKLPWTKGVPMPPRKGAKDYTHPLALAAGANKPINVYPMYENATTAAWGLTPGEALQESADLWSRYSAVAAENPYAWLKKPYSANDIMTPSAQNRLISFPYTKLMVANPVVNQGSAIVLTSLAEARALGVSDEKLVFLWGGALANEPLDIVERASLNSSNAQSAALLRAQQIAAREGAELDAIELYSCFPVVPKMTSRILGLGPHVVPTVTGGLTFFGAPLNNYMSHATCAMVRHLRSRREHTGLLYGQGGFVTKHHSLVVGTRPPSTDFARDDGSAQAEVDAKRLPAPPLREGIFEPRAKLEAHTVIYGRDGSPEQGIAVLRFSDDSRTFARVPATDSAGIATLIALDRSPIGLMGDLRAAADGFAEWHPTP